MDALTLAQRFVGVVRVRPAGDDDPFIVAFLELVTHAPEHDEVPWCSAFVNFIAWLLDLPRSNSLAARSWLAVGQPVQLADAQAGNDVVVLSRGLDPQPGPDVLSAPGHVGFFVSSDGVNVTLCGGNQSQAVSIKAFPVEHVLGVRRLA